MVDDSFYWNAGCLDCYNCKQKTVRTIKELEDFLYEKNYEVRKGWREKLLKNGKLSLYWCTKNRSVRIKTNPPDRAGYKRIPGKFCHHIDN